MSAHTYGPWHVNKVLYPAGQDVSFEVLKERQLIAQTIMREVIRDDVAIAQDEANVQLIAAAPDLLAALKGVLAGFDANAFCRNTDGDGQSDWAVKFLPHFQALAAATAAIAKAEATS